MHDPPAAEHSPRAAASIVDIKRDKRRQIVIVEQQGHGRTADRSGPLHYELMADDTTALLRELNLGPADVFGYSDGGIVAVGMAIRAPDAVRRIAIFGAMRRIAIFGANGVSVKNTHEPTQAHRAIVRHASASTFISYTRKTLRESK